jgi:hypothetical protein
VTFLLNPLGMYEKMEFLSDVLHVSAAVLLVVAAVLIKYRPNKSFTGRGIAFCAWIATVIANIVPIFVPYAQVQRKGKKKKKN